MNLYLVSNGNNDTKISSHPLDYIEKYKGNIIYGHLNEFLFSTKLVNTGEDMIMSLYLLKNTNRKILIDYIKNDIESKFVFKLFSFKMNYKSIEMPIYNFNNSIYINYNYTSLLFLYLQPYLPNELIYLIVSFLKHKIDYSFFTYKIKSSNSIDNNAYYLTKPSFFIPKILI